MQRMENNNNTFPKWSMAIWKEEDMEEGVIPSSWIKEKSVRRQWGLNALPAMKEMRTPAIPDENTLTRTGAISAADHKKSQGQECIYFNDNADDVYTLQFCI